MREASMLQVGPVQDLAKFFWENGAEIFTYVSDVGFTTKGHLIALFDDEDQSICVLTTVGGGGKILVEFPGFENEMGMPKELIENSKFYRGVIFANCCCHLGSLRNNIGKRVIFSRSGSYVREGWPVSVMFRSLIGMLSQFHFL